MRFDREQTLADIVASGDMLMAIGSHARADEPITVILFEKDWYAIMAMLTAMASDAIQSDNVTGDMATSVLAKLTNEILRQVIPGKD